MRATAALISLGLLLVAGGCGSSTEAGAREQDSPTITAERPSPDNDYEADSYASAWFAFDDQAEPGSGPAPAKELAVFREPAKPSDEFPPAEGEDGLNDDEVPERYRPGKELLSQAKLLVDGAGAKGFELFGVPTEKGWVCLHLIAADDPMGGGSGTCIPALADGVAYSMGGTTAAYQVLGLIANDVRGVRIVAGKRSEQAVLGRNAFFVQVDPKKICPTEIEFLILEKAKGRSQKVSLSLEGSAADRDPSFGCS